MPDTAPIPTINSISIEGEDYQIEDTVARARADALALSVYGVGDLYLSMNSTSPAARFGGEWEQLENVFLRAANDTETGGSDTVALTQDQLPTVSGSFKMRRAENSVGITYMVESGTGIVSVADGANLGTFKTSSAGGSSAASQIISVGFGKNEPHSVMPAYQNVYVWQRVA